MPKHLSTRQLADHLGVTPETVRRWLRSGKVKPAGQTPSGQYRFHPDQVRAILKGPRLTDRAYDIAMHVHVAREKIRQLRRKP